jgi:hypothetical protein
MAGIRFTTGGRPAAMEASGPEAKEERSWHCG